MTKLCDVVDTESAKDTELFLLTLSRRLSGREDCRGQNYDVLIGENNSVVMMPDVQIYPNRYSKKDADKVSVVWYVMYLFGGKSIKLVPGHYIYTSSIDKKKRQWRRKDGNEN